MSVQGLLKNNGRNESQTILRKDWMLFLSSIFLKIDAE